MKRWILSTLLLFAAIFTYAQRNPVQWSFSKEKISDTEYILKFTADVTPGWVIYSQYLESDDGPIPTSFTFETTRNMDLVGQTEEKGHLEESYDEIFEMVLKKLDGKVVFEQKVKTNGPQPLARGYLTFMTCDNERCLPPKDIDFEFDLK